MDLPKDLRPRVGRVRTPTRGLELPSWFLDDLRGIDENTYVIWHPYKVIWDDVMNEYEGDLEDPRFCIHEEYGETNWGWVTTNNKGEPDPDCSWHLWRLARPRGWCHVLQLEDLSQQYLRLVLRRLHLQASYSDRYGHLAYNRYRDEESAAMREQRMNAHQEMMGAVQEENEWLVRKAMDNFDRGHVKPTNPQIEQVISYPGQTHRSTVKRPMTDEDGGLIVPNSYK
jgi:hypothetical protein